MRIYFFILLNILSFINTKSYPQICTDSVKDLVDSCMNVAISMEKNNYLPDHDSLKSVLYSVEEIIEKCANKKSRIPEYYGCFDRMYLVLPSIQDLAVSIIGQEWEKVAKDSVNIVVELVNGITYCIDVQN